MFHRRNRRYNIILLSHSIQLAQAALEYLDDENEDERNVQRKERSCWESDWVKKRPTEGVCAKLLKQLESADTEIERKLFTAFSRLSRSDFDHLHELVAPHKHKVNTNMRAAIPTRTRLALTLHFLSTGNSFRSMQYLFLIPQCTISKIVPETLDAIYKVLAPNYLKTPSTAEDWRAIATKFQDSWNFPNCLGAVDGKHVVMGAPPNSGSVYYNYKGSHSIVLMAICDAEYKFLYVDVGCNGRQSDGGVFNKCSFSKCMENETLNFPPAQALPGRQKLVPFVLVGDDAFALRPNLMKPYGGQQLFPAKKVFNYRLSRCRRIIENTFGIMSAVWRVIRSPVNLDASKTRKVVLAVCVLHNFMLTRNGRSFAPLLTGDADRGCSTINEVPSTCLIDLERAPGRDRSQTANELRSEFEEYFMTTGSVPWHLMDLRQ